MAAAKMNKENKSESESFDVVVIGGGAAGMSAALWCDELGLKTLLLEENNKLGGQLWRVYNPIKNHLGADAENGQELQKTFLKQIKSRKVSVRTKSKISAINLKKKSVVLENGGEINWKFLVIAVGVSRRKLGVEGEEKFQKRGIIESGKRDAQLVKNKSVVIIGGGDAALENALILAETASEVTVVHRREDFRAREEFLEKAEKNKKVKMLTETVVTKFGGEKKLNSVELKNLKTKKVWKLTAEAVLLRIGVEPNTKIFQGKINLDKQGYIKINENCETSAQNVFAVGDVANPLAPTVSSAVGMGATAAKVIFSKLNS
jgi:thioredoxin reductase (NADPH)